MCLKRFYSIILVMSLLISFLYWTGFPMQRVESKQTTLTESSHPIHETQPGFFTENKGQWDSRIKFIGYSSFGKIAFTNDALYYQLIKREKTQKKK